MKNLEKHKTLQRIIFSIRSVQQSADGFNFAPTEAGMILGFALALMGGDDCGVIVHNHFAPLTSLHITVYLQHHRVSPKSCLHLYNNLEIRHVKPWHKQSLSSKTPLFPSFQLHHRNCQWNYILHSGKLTSLHPSLSNLLSIKFKPLNVISINFLTKLIPKDYLNSCPLAFITPERQTLCHKPIVLSFNF